MIPACAGIELFGSVWPVAAFAAVCALIGAMIPVFFNFLFLSRKDRNDADQTRFENSRALLTAQTDRRNDFTAALTKAVRKSKPSIDDIHAIMKTGEAYFETLRVMSDAILDGRISGNVRDRDFVPKISEALQKNIPLYYETLTNVSSKFGLQYDGVFKESNYDSLFYVVDQYDHQTWLDVRSNMALVP